MYDVENMMEIIVKDRFDKVIDQLDCCQCERCKSDIIAYALNHLPAKYVTSVAGQLFAKLEYFSLQNEANVLTALIQAAKIVNSNPHHDVGYDKAVAERMRYEQAK